MYPDLSAFGRAEFPVTIGAFRGPVPVGETGSGGSGSEMLPTIMPNPPAAPAPSVQASKAVLTPPPMVTGGEMPIAQDPVPTNDPLMGAAIDDKNRFHTIMKYGIIGLLGAASGLIIAHQMDKSKLAGVSIGGLGAVGILLIGDFIKFSQNISQEISPLFVAD